MKGPIAVLFILLFWQIQAQAQPSHPDFCAQHFLQEKLYQENPELRDFHEELEKNYSKINAQERGQLMPYVLPIVVHVVHDNGAENISDAMVLQGIQHLNEAYANMGYYDQGTGVNTQIQFCLAKRDPDGNATTGINHVQSPLTELDYSTQDLALKNVIRWDPLRYINIWLVREICSNNGCGVAGYAYFPSAHGGLHDGIVMEAKWFGSSNGSSGVQIHEMGHYLGLYHTFEGGCTNNDCLADGDRVCDTPPDQSTAPVPCGGTANSCTTDTQSGFATDQPDMFWNYMDYGDWDCYSAFTQGQTDRMYFFIENVRHSLLDSDACLDPCTIPITAGFTSSDNLVDIGASVDFTNTSANASGYQWLIDGVPFGNGANAAYTFNALGTYVITLEVTNADPNCFDSVNDTIEVVCPVIASFTPTNLFPLPGEIVNFANNSAGGTNFNWSVNGVSQAATMGFSYVFPTEGAYTICLDVDNGLCEREYCQLVFAYNQENSCESGFVRVIGNQGLNEDVHVIIPTGDGDFLIGGQAGNQSQLTRVDGEGNVVWQRNFNFTLGNDFIRNLMIDSEGYLIISGRDQFNTTCVSFIAKFDLQTQTLIWTRVFPIAYIRIEGIVEKPGNGNYILYGLVGPIAPENYILEVNKNNGAVLWQRSFDLGGNTDIYQRHLLIGDDLYFAGAQRFSGGLDLIRASIAKFDLDGNMDYTRIYFNTPNETGRTYAEDIFNQGDTLVTLSRGVLTGSNLAGSGAQLLLTNLNGVPYWAKNYLITGGTELFSRTLLPLPDGYILQGYYLQGADEDIFFIRVDKAGNLVWAKGVSTPQNDRCMWAEVYDNAIYFAAGSEGYDGPGSNDILYGRIPVDISTLNTDCDLFVDLQVVVQNIPNPYHLQVSLIEDDPGHSTTSTFIQTQPTESEITDIPSCTCTDSIPCVSSFVRSLGTGAAELATRIIPEPGGGFIIGGSKADSTMIALLDSDGHPVWVYTLKVTNLPIERVSDLLIDSDQNLVGIVTGFSTTNTTSNYLFKLDYQTSSLHWIRQPNPATFNAGQLLSIQEIAPGGNYLVAGQTSPNNPPGSGCDGVLMEIERSPGALLWVKNYHLGSCETFSKIVVHANSVYATGRYNFAGGGLDKMRPGITQTDLSGNELWSRLYLRNITGNFIARLYSADIVVDNGLVVPGHGDMDGTDAVNVSLQLFKTDYTGNLLWAREFDITGGDTERFTRLINLPDGYLGIGTFNLPGSGSQVFLIKTDKNGVAQWSKHYGGPGADAGADILFQGGYLYLAGTYANLGADVLLARLTLDGDTADACDAIEDLAITQSAISNPYSGSHPLTVYNTAWPFLNPPGSFQFSGLPENVLCETACLDSCLVAPDAFFQVINAHCNGDSLLVTVEVCNEGPGILYAGTPVNFYDGDPAAGGVLVGSGSLPEDLAELFCATWSLPLAAPTNTTLYAWVNDLNAPGFDTLECDLADNITTFSVPYAPPLLDLGPDTVMCGFGVVALEANAGFASYLWPDGSTAATYTALEPGVHWVVATDSCGGVQTDTVNIIVYSSAISYDTLEFCPGDTVLIFGQPVTVAGEYSALLTGFNGCDSVAVLTLVESTDTIFTVSASAICAGETYTFYGQTLDVSGVYEWADTSSSCVKLETLTLTVQDTFATAVMLTTCANEPIDIFGVPSSVAGAYSQTFAALNGCDSTHTIFLTVLDTVATSEALTTCANQAVDIFGNPVNTAGVYEQTFAGINGCDSLHTIQLTVLDTAAILENLAICEGESALIFGVPTSVAGTYVQTFAAANGCDSVHTVVLTVADTAFVSETITTCANEPVDIFGVPTSVTGTYEQLFQTTGGCDSTHVIQLVVLDTLAVFQGIATCANEPVDVFGVPVSVAGTYTQTFAAANGCDSVHTITLTVTDTVATSESLTICNGETVIIFGTPVSTTGTYSQTFAGQNGCDSTHSVALTVLTAMQVSISTQAACPGAADGSAAAQVSGGLPPYQYDWGSGPGGNASAGNLGPGNYTLLVTDANGCTASAGFSIQSAPPPSLTTEAQDVTCFGDTDGSLTISAAGPGLSYSLDGQAFSGQAQWANLSPGDYTLYVQDAGGCISEIPFIIGQPAPINVLLPPGISLQWGESQQLTPVVSPAGGVYVYAWSPPDGLSCTDCSAPIVQPDFSGTYVLVVTDTLGCMARATVLVEVERNQDVFIPTMFSPNADGINDAFTIFSGPQVVRIRTMKVFDRWGEKVFEGADLRPNDLSQGWDGTFRGKPMNPGVFGYLAELEFANGIVLVYNGSLTLVR
ncbi:MAG: M43 family zinc metalloprotease [Saprospiraceae bacterium]